MTRSRLPALLGVALAVAGCDSASRTDPMRYGPPVAIGDGEARSFVRLAADGTPEAVGLVLSEDALNGLPGTAAPPGREHEGMHTLAFPAQARSLVLPIDHVSLDWNPEGHEPEGLFTVPHFDMHFYMVPEAERMTWLPTNPQFARKGKRVPDPRYLPEGYISPPGNEPVPLMGYHWVDSTDPTYAPDGPPFTEVFIWGTYDGQVIFPEPMITRAFLQGRPDHTETLAQPQAYARAGYYPTRYSVRHDADARRYVIALEGLTYRPAG